MLRRRAAMNTYRASDRQVLAPGLAPMVKRPLTGDRLSKGLRARFASPLAIEPGPFSAHSRPRAALDTLEPPPTIILLSGSKLGTDRIVPQGKLKWDWEKALLGAER